MFQPWRLKLREAQVALNDGRLDEASRILADGQLREFLPAKKLIARLASRFVRRGRDRLEQGESSAGWEDLAAASKLGVDGRTLRDVTEAAAGRSLEEIVERLNAGDVAGARESLAKFAKRDRANPCARQLERVVHCLDAANQAVRRGRFSEASSQLSAAYAMRPDLRLLERRQADVSLKADRYRELTLAMHEALRGELWSQVLDFADQLLAIAPDDSPARQARQRAWKAAEIRLQASVAPAVNRPGAGPRRGIVTPECDSSAADSSGTAGTRFLLWVDEVGGYLVCMANEVLIGQPVQGSAVDVPLLADLSRRHAKIRRAGEGYVFEAIRDSRVNGRSVAGVSSLSDGDQIELADRVRLRFRQPH
ncbi:MAG: FHA domain-containing protein, partial [Pirellulales bacterium]